MWFAGGSASNFLHENVNILKLAWCTLQRDFVLPKKAKHVRQSQMDLNAANPFETNKQRRENTVQNLLDKLQPEMIQLNPNNVGRVDRTPQEILMMERKKAEEANAAIAAGFTVDLEASNLDRTGAGTSFQSYANNITNEVNADIETNGGLVTKQLSNPDGTSLLRKEADGTVHIGQNSIVLADEAVSASGNDEVYSSSGVLQLGNNDQHRTVIKGTLEVPTPTLGSHAANKSYVDKGDAATLKTANKYSDGIGAMMMAATQVTMTADPGSKLNIGFGLGSLSGENAFAIGLTGSSNDGSFRYSVTASYSDYVDEVAVGAGLSWSLR